MAAGAGVVPDSGWLMIVGEVVVNDRYPETTCNSSDPDMFESFRVSTADRTRGYVLAIVTSFHSPKSECGFLRFSLAVHVTVDLLVRFRR
jgi:hypothetical protein